MTNLTQDQAVGVLIQAARIGQSKGAYTLEDAKVIADAISVFVPAKNESAAETTTPAPELPKSSSELEPGAGC
jgi:hypothetical protein